MNNFDHVMHFRDNELNALAQPKLQKPFRTSEVGVDIIEEVANNDTPLSAFTRMKLFEWKKTQGREQQEMAHRHGIAPSGISQVMSGKLGVGPKLAAKYARAFGFKDVRTFTQAAYDWWLTSGKAADDLIESRPQVASAVDTVVKMNQATASEVKTILLAYTHDRFRDRDEAWWLSTLLTEIKTDRDLVRILDAEEAEKKRRRKTARESTGDLQAASMVEDKGHKRPRKKSA